MNQKEYKRAVKDARTAAYKKNLKGVIGAIARALIAYNDPDETPAQLPGKARKQLPPRK